MRRSTPSCGSKALHGDAIPGTADNLLDAAEGENYEWTDICPDGEGRQGRGALTTWLSCLKKWERSSVSTKTATASCWRMLRAALCSPRDGDMVWQCSNCGHIVIGKNAPEVCPPSARIRRHISSSRLRTTKPYSGFKSPHIPQAAAGFSCRRFSVPFRQMPACPFFLAGQMRYTIKRPPKAVFVWMAPGRETAPKMACNYFLLWD